MPATAGRVRMPANNRVHSSAALQTHGIWQSAIGYDPYAPNKDDSKIPSNQVAADTAEPEGENAYTSFQGLLALARITGSNADEVRGACKKCGRVGHLTFQCKNLVSVKENKEKESEAVQAAVLNGLDKLKGGKVNGKKEVESEDDEEEEEEEEESENSDSDADSEIERIIAKRSGKNVSSKRKISSKKKKDYVSDSDYGERKKRGRSKKRSGRKRRSSDSDDENGSRRKRRKRDDYSDDDDDLRHRKRKIKKGK